MCPDHARGVLGYMPRLSSVASQELQWSRREHAKSTTSCLCWIDTIYYSLLGTITVNCGTELIKSKSPSLFQHCSWSSNLWAEYPCPSRSQNASGQGKDVRKARLSIIAVLVEAVLHRPWRTNIYGDQNPITYASFQPLITPVVLNWASELVGVVWYYYKDRACLVTIELV